MTVVLLQTCHHKKEIHLLEQSSVEVDTTQNFLLDFTLAVVAICIVVHELVLNYCGIASIKELAQWQSTILQVWEPEFNPQKPPTKSKSGGACL